MDPGRYNFQVVHYSSGVVYHCYFGSPVHRRGVFFRGLDVLFIMPYGVAMMPQMSAIFRIVEPLVSDR